ncbi:hypothetical protein [Kitasatospora cheerisanensis]|uniref:Putative aminotransferase n=1 Tax=Kitasatospora cheerisanensis KCTC 2395 TaxID=1348663 RepID=A0A066YU31_9ACTN|nr:hypothetical protein [Kitasatospora cheerisanensis]KDN81591.1 putative aminotransferase [Kitasatospora cheerisanensis KCTC 2395]
MPHPVAVAVTDGAPNVVTLNSVGKTFNVSGVPSCLALVPDPALGGAVLARPQASFLLWLDGSGLGTREESLTQRQVELADGAGFGPAGSGCLRLNFALPLDRLRTALTRLTCGSAG